MRAAGARTSRGGYWIVAQPRRDYVDGNALRERERRGRVAQGVQGSSGEAGRLPLLPKPPGEPMRVNRAAELVAEH